MRLIWFINAPDQQYRTRFIWYTIIIYKRLSTL